MFFIANSLQQIESNSMLWGGRILHSLSRLQLMDVVLICILVDIFFHVRCYSQCTGYRADTLLSLICIVHLSLSLLKSR